MQSAVRFSVAVEQPASGEALTCSLGEYRPGAEVVSPLAPTHDLVGDVGSLGAVVGDRVPATAKEIVSPRGGSRVQPPGDRTAGRNPR